MNQEIQAIVFRKPNEVVTGSFELGPCGPTDIIVRTRYTMVCPAGISYIGRHVFA